MEVLKDPKKEIFSILDQAYELNKKFRLVRDIMSQNVVTTTLNKTMDRAAKTMGEMRIGSLVVLKDSKPVGIVTERDLLSHVLAKGIDPKTVRVEEIMSSPLISINPSVSIKEAAQTMIKEKGRLTVFENEKLVGIITASDLTKSMPQVRETVLWVNEFMTKGIITADEKTLVSEVVNIMGNNRIGSVVVTGEGEPWGIFTERDLLTTFLAKGKSLNIPVGEACSSPLKVITSKTTVHEAAHLMSSKHVRRLPVVENHDIVGIITARDLVKAYAK